MLQDLAETARIMQSVLAPVFLISGVAALLGPMAARYGRVIDRVRVLLREVAHRTDDRELVHLRWEIRALHYRARILRTVVIFASATIFFVVSTIFLMFSEFVLAINVASAPIFLFVAALISLLVAMGFFIQDFAISLRVLKIDISHGIKGELGSVPGLSP